tara:strand:+ start:219 stop:593 length:375 start_codon:yes stop_codon:yes gene_type:complete
MIKPKDLKVGQTVYAFTGDHVHEVVIKKKGSVWFDIKPFELHGNLDLRRKKTVMRILKWVHGDWQLRDSRECGDTALAELYTSAEEAQNRLDAVILASKIRKAIHANLPLATLKLMVELLEKAK